MSHEFIKHLKEDHKKQKEIAAKLIEETNAKTRTSLRQEFWEELYPHLMGEEASVFPFLLKAKEKEVQEDALENLEEHEVAKNALQAFMDCDPKSDVFKAKISVLNELNNHHIKEEEKEALKALAQLCDKECLDDLMKKYEAAEEKAKKKKK